MKKAFLILILITLAPLLMMGKGISPYEYGLKEAKTGSERASILYKTHMAAIEAGVPVDYSGIRSIDIEITSAKSSSKKGCKGEASSTVSLLLAAMLLIKRKNRR